jgi:GT2 family glycosyltransferase
MAVEKTNGQPLIYLIILNWNGWKDTIKCLNSIQQLDYPKYRIIVVDNDSRNDSVEQIKAWTQGKNITKSADVSLEESKKALTLIVYDQQTAEKGGTYLEEKTLATTSSAQGLVLICSEENLGFSGGCNTGITYALKRGADFVFLLNNDARIAPDALTHLVTVAQKADAAMVGARVLDESGLHVLFAGRSWPRQLFFGGSSRHYDLNQVFWQSSDAEGSAVLLRRDFLEQRFSEYSYFLDPKLFMYCEDIDLCLYGKVRGYNCVIARDAIIYHGLAKSSGGKGNPRSYYYITRNRIYLVNRWLNLPWKICFHLYYIPSRLILQTLRFKKWSSVTAMAVISGIFDGRVSASQKLLTSGFRGIIMLT